MGVLHNYTEIRKLSNIFSYCTIGGDGYDPDYEITLTDNMNNVRNVNYLFYKCKSNDGPLKIRRSFFEHLPNVTTLVNTFNSVEFDHMLSYDFFCKRKEQTEKVYVKVNGTIPANTNAILHTYIYTKDQSDLYGCFRNAKFINCKSWFDLMDDNEDLKQPKDILTEKDSNTDGDTGNELNVDTYYKKVGTSFIEYKISEPTSYTDTLNNFTNYVDSIIISSGGTEINNHNIFGNEGDFEKYGTDNFGMPYIKVENVTNIYPTYCCLPPDILYGCDSTCDLQYVFADTNIIGTLPQHLLGNRVSSRLNDIFRNVNILPNLIYHCDSRISGNQNYIDMLNGRLGDYSYLISTGGIPIDNDTINPDGETQYPLIGNGSNDATVLFRNSDGELRRRYHTDNTNISQSTNRDYNKSQFAYVPQGFTVNKYLENAFTFRYNLPEQINLSRSAIQQEIHIDWGMPGKYDESNGPENYPEKWPYYTQYFFTTDESVSWKNVTTMKSPFISDDQDVDFITGQTRVLSTSDMEHKNKWWAGDGDVTKDIWHPKTGGLLNVFLNICGMKDTRIGVFRDCGALINRSIDARNIPNLERFVSGILVVFLNGRVFDDNVDGIRLTGQNGSRIISYDKGFGRNIILPRLGPIPYSDMTQVPKVLLSFPSSSDTTMFYKYMFPNDDNIIRRYQDIYGIVDSQIYKSNYDEYSSKYILIP